jgi:hypothetical protein
MPSKKYGVLLPTNACFAHANHFFFFIYKKTIISLIPHNNYKKKTIKKYRKYPFILGEKKSWPQELWDN